MPTLIEILVLVLIVLLVFTAGRLGDLGDGIGRLIHGEPAPEPPAPGDAENEADSAVSATPEQEDLD